MDLELVVIGAPGALGVREANPGNFWNQAEYFPRSMQLAGGILRAHLQQAQ